MLKIAIGCLTIIFFIILFAVMGGVVFTLLWNLVIPTAFGGPTLSFIQGTALMLVIGMIGSAFVQ